MGTFIITEGWLKSGNCWQELDWASKIRNISTGKITLFIFTKQEYYDRLEANQDYKDGKKVGDGGFRQEMDGTPHTFNWPDLKKKIRFKGPYVADTVDEVQNHIDSWRGYEWWPW